MARSWRVVGNFHRTGELAVIVTAPNWQGGLRKGALALKNLEQLKGRRIAVASFTIQEVDTPPATAPAEQMSMPAVSHPISVTATVGPSEPQPQPSEPGEQLQAGRTPEPTDEQSEG